MRAIGAAGGTTQQALATGISPATAPAATDLLRAGAPVAIEGPGTALPPIAIELVNADAVELGGVLSAASGSGLRVQVSQREVSVREAMATLDEPVESRSQQLAATREQLLHDLRTGKGDPREIIKKLDGLSVLIDVAKRQEEKRLLMKKLLKALMLGALTPSLISQAKSLGLVSFLKEAIKEMVKKGFLSPQQLSAVAGMLAQAGIQMPLLEDLVIRHEQAAQGVQDAARLARGKEPVGSTPTLSAAAGAAELGTPSTGATTTA